MKYKFNYSEVSLLSDEMIPILCYHRSNRGDGEFHQN